jgi:hypothetical protein
MRARDVVSSAWKGKMLTLSPVAVSSLCFYGAQKPLHFSFFFFLDVREQLEMITPALITDHRSLPAVSFIDQ